MTTNTSSDYDDEIDLRAIFQTLWKARRLIFIITLAAAVAAFAVSFWILPRTYQATAYVFIGQPVIGIEQTTGFTISPTLPDLSAVVKLAAAPGLLESITNDPAVVAAMEKEEFSFAKMTTAAAVGKDQLSLQVIDKDPQRAALLANIWAEKVIDVVNATYGLGTLAQTLDTQILHSQKDYESAQAALEDALSNNQVDALSAQLDSRKADLASVLDSIIRTKSVLDDLQFFEQGLNGLSGETPLSLGDGLALTTLRQRSLTVASDSFTVQIDSASFAGFTVLQALEATTQMRTGLQSQLTRLQSNQSRLEQEIPQLQKDLEEMQAQLDQFSLMRDQSKELNSALLQQQLRVTTVLGQSAKVANLSVEAVPPEKAVSRKTLMNTALAGMLGLMLSAFVVLAMNWWRNE